MLVVSSRPFGLHAASRTTGRPSGHQERDGEQRPGAPDEHDVEPDPEPRNAEQAVEGAGCDESEGTMPREPSPPKSRVEADDQRQGRARNHSRGGRDEVDGQRPRLEEVRIQPPECAP